MKQTLSFLALLAALFAVGCGNTAHHPSDFTEDIYVPAYASGFNIRGASNCFSTLLTIHNPWQGADDVEQYLYIVRNGESVPDEFTGQVVKAPVHHVVCMSSSHVAEFEAIGQAKRICGVSGIDYISNKHVNEHRSCGEVRDVGYDTNLNFELLAAMEPDLVLMYGVTGENTIVTGKLRELGIPYVYVGDYMEESPLGKAEWLMIAAELCDIRDTGREVFEGIAARYNALKASVPAAGPRPKVMLNTPYRDTWFMPSSQSYAVRLIEDAGGEYIYTKNNSNTSVAINIEEAYQLANVADVWLNVGTCNTLGELAAQNPKFAEIPAVRSQRVYNNNRRQTPAGGSDFWESGVVQPDVVLQDLIQILRGDGSDIGCAYYKRLE